MKSTRCNKRGREQSVRKLARKAARKAARKKRRIFMFWVQDSRERFLREMPPRSIIIDELAPTVDYIRTPNGYASSAWAPIARLNVRVSEEMSYE